MSIKPKISVIIPIKNGMGILDKCLQGLQKQTIFSQCEIIAIDSGSTDGTLEMLKGLDVNLIAINSDEFNHGSTRNLGVANAKGEFVFMTVQDAWFDDFKVLERMMTHFSDPEVAGVCGQQIVPHNKHMNPHEWFRPQSEPEPYKVQFKNIEDFLQLSPTEQRKACGWDNVIAMYRKSVLKTIPFRKTDFAEDLQWAKDAVLKGFAIVYDHRNRINHYHHSTPSYVFKRTFIVLYSYYKIFEEKRDLRVPTIDYFKIPYRNYKMKAHPKWMAFNLKSKKAKDKAYKTFMEAVSISDNALDEAYKKICHNIPQGKSY